MTAMPEVPPTCSLTLYPHARVEAGTVPDQHEDEVVFDAECTCGQWEKEMCTPVQSAEDQARAAWLTEHLNATSDGAPKSEDPQTDA